MFLLQWLDTVTKDVDTKQHIVETRQYVQAAIEKMAAASDGEVHNSDESFAPRPQLTLHLPGE